MKKTDLTPMQLLGDAIVKFSKGAPGSAKVLRALVEQYQVHDWLESLNEFRINVGHKPIDFSQILQKEVGMIPNRKKLVTAFVMIAEVLSDALGLQGEGVDGETQPPKTEVKVPKKEAPKAEEKKPKKEEVVEDVVEKTADEAAEEYVAEKTTEEDVVEEKPLAEVKKAAYEMLQAMGKAGKKEEAKKLLAKAGIKPGTFNEASEAAIRKAYDLLKVEGE